MSAGRGLRALPRLGLWLALGRLGVLAIVVLALAPMPDTGLDLPQGDKLGHVLAYFAITAWYAQLCATRAALLWRALAFLALGLLLEALQSLTGWRHGNDPLDMLANTLGVAGGTLLGFSPAARVLQHLDRARRR